ncbi:Transcription factor IIIB subunit [Vanrija pseudolonga]|uniref:B-related factor 1 n=1 Tax=Vanrija pseudolonga TaxID=143232 RepID=A0AAF0YEQ5_9TREE|nr:Transcription factor IIIB subunit [Vanrija pseudolonga]
MAPPTVCPQCKSTDIAVNYADGNVVCQSCGLELAKDLLVSEVGFTEGAGGRVHQSGTFLVHGATTFAGLPGGNANSSESIKAEGRKRIEQICSNMGILLSVSRTAQRFYSLVVDNKFNRGRRTDYVLSSCLYLASRVEKEPSMLIDFSERFQINVYELGATYLKLRQALNLDRVLPEIDPAVYNIRFANRLDFGNKATMVATDASRLVKRFQADWMTAGRRPAGICGACIIIAARMNNFLRTPEEVAQVVKVSPLTIKKRLIEFSQTDAANKTVEEWRALTDAELAAADETELPPSMKREIAKKQKLEAERKRKRSLEEDEEEESTPAETPAATPAGTPSTWRKKRNRDANGVLRKIAQEVNDVGEGEGDDEEDLGMAALAKEDYVVDLQNAGDNSPEAKAQRARERRQLMASLKQADGRDAEAEEIADVDDDDNAQAEGDEEVEIFDGFKDIPSPPDWDDTEAVYDYIEEHIFNDQELIYGSNKAAMRERIDRWLQGRSAEEVINEMRRVEWARHHRELFAKEHREETFDDIDDDELDQYWVMEDDERETRARIWLSSNGKWLEEDKERQERKAALARAAELNPKPKAKKRKRGTGNGQRGPFPSARDAIDNFAAQKKFSARINMDAIRKIGMGSNADYEDGLQSMGDEKDDEKEDEEHDSRYDEKEERIAAGEGNEEEEVDWFNQ